MTSFLNCVTSFLNGPFRGPKKNKAYFTSSKIALRIFWIFLGNCDIRHFIWVYCKIDNLLARLSATRGLQYEAFLGRTHQGLKTCIPFNFLKELLFHDKGFFVG